VVAIIKIFIRVRVSVYQDVAVVVLTTLTPSERGQMYHHEETNIAYFFLKNGFF